MMRAMVLFEPKTPLKLVDWPVPAVKDHQILIRVSTCGVCRTDLHILDGELAHPALPLILGHQIVGRVVSIGTGADPSLMGKRVGVPWLGRTCGKCRFCLNGKENLCELALYTGYQVNGGFAEYCAAYGDFAFPIPDSYSDLEAAPLLCAGLIGYRAYRAAGNGKRLGIYGFGSAGHLILQLAVQERREVYVFTRPNDRKTQNFALKLGAVSARSSEEAPEKPLDACIIFASDGKLVPYALKAVDKGGIVVTAGIHMSDIPSFPYSILWEERSIRSIANLTRLDGKELLEKASLFPIKANINAYPLEEANLALSDLKHGASHGSFVLEITR